MFQFALHSHATENATVVYLTGFRAEALVGRHSAAMVDRSAGRSIDLDNFDADRSRGLWRGYWKSKKIKKSGRKQKKMGGMDTRRSGGKGARMEK